MVQGLAALQKIAGKQLAVTLAADADGAVWPSIGGELEQILSEPNSALQRCDGLLELARELAAAQVIEVGKTIGDQATGLVLHALQALGRHDGQRFELSEPTLPSPQRRATLDAAMLADPNTNQLDHVLSSLGIAGTVASLVSAAVPGVGWVAGGAVLVWMTQRRRSAAQHRQFAALRRQMDTLLKGDLAAAQASAIVSMTAMLQQVADRGAYALQELARARRTDVEGLRNWVADHQTRGRGEQLEVAREAKAQAKERSRNNSITLVLQGAASRLSSRELATHLAGWNCPSCPWTVPKAAAALQRELVSLGKSLELSDETMG